ncbi:hypothetical protein GCM10010199_71480 [Dactylosporangium roseum]
MRAIARLQQYHRTATSPYPRAGPPVLPAALIMQLWPPTKLDILGASGHHDCKIDAEGGGEGGGGCGHRAVW